MTAPSEEELAELDVTSLSPPSLIRNLLDTLAVESVQDLLALDLDEVAVMRGVGRGKVDALSELVDRARSLAHDEWSPSPSLLEEVDAAGVDLDTPWRAILIGVDARTSAVLERAGVETLRELTIRYEASTLMGLPGFGATMRERVGAQLDALATLGFERYLFGDLGRPERVSDALRVFLASDGPDRELARRRFLDGHTLEELGDWLGLSRERARQRLERCLEQGVSHVGPILVELLGPLIDLLEAQGGLATLEHAATLCACSHGELALALALASEPASRRAFGDLTVVTPLSSGSLDDLLERWRVLLEEAPPYLSDELLTERAARAGLRLSHADLRALAIARWGAEPLPGELASPWRGLDARAAHLLMELGEPCTIEQVREALVARHGMAEPPSERQVYHLLQRSDDAYYVARGRWAHGSILPDSPDDLARAACWCVAELEGTSHAVSAAIFIEPLRDLGMISEGVTSLLLRDVIGRHADARVFQSTDFVAHVASFVGPRVTQRERVEQILLDAHAPMRCDDVCAAMPDFVSFSRDAVYLTLLNAPYTRNLGRGRFVHCDVEVGEDREAGEADE